MEYKDRYTNTINMTFLTPSQILKSELIACGKKDDFKSKINARVLSNLVSQTSVTQLMENELQKLTTRLKHITKRGYVINASVINK